MHLAMETIYTPVRFKERTLRILFLVMQVIIMKIYYASKRVEREFKDEVRRL